MLLIGGHHDPRSCRHSGEGLTLSGQYIVSKKINRNGMDKGFRPMIEKGESKLTPFS